jgi:phosphopantothenoylcysteine decarboxylase/phosphopantothenate--cysteine ligase
MFKRKTIVIGVCGGIAAYKACDLVSRLKKLNAEIKVIMTKSATEFISPMTFQTLSSNKVCIEMFETVDHWDVEHISIAKAADVFLVVPATANVIGKIAGGIADDMLTTTIMATTAPKIIAPAMNSNMYLNPIVQKNMSYLKSLGYHFVEPDSGILACGDIGVGKLADNDKILDVLRKNINTNENASLGGKKILITAGPTKESIDPVRFITNHSTGKMGYAIAKKAVEMGAEVTLISGPVNLENPAGLKKIIRINSALEMFDAVKDELENCDIVVKSAAVADYRPAKYEDNKIKKSDGNMIIELERNPDILKYIGDHKNNKILVGFAAETENVLENGKKKLKSKNLDFIVVNNLKESGAGFGFDTNIVSIIDRDGSVKEYNLMHKEEVAQAILNKVVELL